MIVISIAFILIGPIIELMAAIALGSVIGGFNTFLLIVALSVAGILLLKVEGVAALNGIRRDLNSGRLPARGLIDGFLRMLGAILLALPGLVSTTIGILLLIAPVRKLLSPLVMASLATRAKSRVSRIGFTSVMVDGSGVRVDSTYMGGGEGPSKGATHNSAGEIIDAEGWEIEDHPALPPHA